MDLHYRPSPGSQTLCKACMPRPTMPYWSSVACTPVTGATECLSSISWMASCCCPRTPDDSNGVAYLSPWRLGTVKASLRFAKLLLVTTTLIAYAQFDNLVVVDAYQCLHHWHLPAWFKAAYLINTAHGGDAGEHWLGVFLKDSQHAEYFNSFGIAPPESIYRRMLSMDYLDIWYSTKMLQGLFSRSCGLYAFYFLAMCSQGVPLGIITGAFQKYDYSEAQIRWLLGWHTHAYTQRQQPLIVIRPPVYIGETVNASTLVFLAIETPPSSWSPPF